MRIGEIVAIAIAVFLSPPVEGSIAFRRRGFSTAHGMWQTG